MQNQRDISSSVFPHQPFTPAYISQTFCSLTLFYFLRLGNVLNAQMLGCSLADFSTNV